MIEEKKPFPPIPEELIIKLDDIPDDKRPQEARDRKARSIEILKTNNVPYLDDLPTIETSDEAKIREKDDVWKRAIALYATIEQAISIKHGEPGTFMNIVNYAKCELTKNEQEIFTNIVSPEKISMCFWRIEALWVLLWALGFVDELKIPSQECKFEDIQNIIHDKRGYEQPLVGFIDAIKMRSKSEILDEADLIYRVRWACVDARINNKEIPENINPDVAVERHMALNWLISYGDNWDNIPINT